MRLSIRVSMPLPCRSSIGKGTMLFTTACTCLHAMRFTHETLQLLTPSCKRENTLATSVHQLSPMPCWMLPLALSGQDSRGLRAIPSLARYARGDACWLLPAFNTLYLAS